MTDVNARNFGNARTLKFNSSDLGRHVDLMLMFQPPGQDILYKKLFPVCWNLLKFEATGISAATVEYTSDTGFLVPQKNTDDIIVACSSRRCNTGQTCTLRTDEDGDNFLTPAAEGDPNIIECEIDTSSPGAVGFGLFDTKDTIVPVFEWTEISRGSTATVDILPNLLIYAVSDYRVSELVRGKIHSDILFEEELLNLPAFSSWDVYIEEKSNAIRISRKI